MSKRWMVRCRWRFPGARAGALLLACGWSAGCGAGPNDAGPLHASGDLSGYDIAGSCIGARPPPPAFSAFPSPLRTTDGGPLLPDGGCSGAGCAAAQLPLWALLDFQPASCGHGATYGPELYRGKAVLIALWAGW